MPSWTLNDLMSKATTRVGRRVDISTSDVSFWVNEAYQDVAQADRHGLLEQIAVSSTTSGENRLGLPTDFMYPIDLSYLTTASGSGKTLFRTSEVRADATGFTPVAKPTHYVLYNNYIELWPSPDSAYSLQLRYQRYPSDLTALTDVPSVDTPWRKAILYQAEAYLHEHVGNEMEAAAARQRYIAYSLTMSTSNARRQQDRSGMRISLSYRKERY